MGHRRLREKNMNHPKWFKKSHSLILTSGEMRHGRLILYVLLVLSAAALPTPARAAQRLEITTLSSRPDMATGGDALVQVTGPAEIMANKLSIWVNGRNVTSAFHVSPFTQTLMGLVDGLAPGKNRLVVKAGSKVRGQLEIINHAITGPIFYGPHQTPFICQTQSMGLGPALDADCSAKTQVTYFYKSTLPPQVANPKSPLRPDDPTAGFRSFDPSAPTPDDIAQVKTTEGKNVRYIVRREVGTINRAIYEIAFLHEPGTHLPDPWRAIPGWNRRLVYSFDGGCGSGYHQGNPPNAVHGWFLSRGYAVISSSLNVFGNNCDDVISAETMAMMKEYFTKRFGVPVHTIGWGGSGAAMQQLLISQNYPGLLDGIVPREDFPDYITVAPGLVDCTLLAHAFENFSPPWTLEQKVATSGLGGMGTCETWIQSGYSPNWARPQACGGGMPRALIFDPISNPQGTRCDLYDNEVNVFGRDPKTGYARRPLDNVGVQYGLVAFNAGKISAEQFLELNEKVGGYDINGNIVPARMAGDPEALRLAYQTGRVDTGGGSLGSIPIVDIRTYLDYQPNVHDSFRSFAIRARLMAANGTADNQVIMTIPRGRPGKNPHISENVEMPLVLPLMDRWLDNIAADKSSRSVLEKTVAARPEGLADMCWDENGDPIIEKRIYGDNGRCNQLYPPHGDSRIAAGEPIANDILKCALKPVNPGDYVHPLSEEQLTRLRAVFPQGVCDYTRPGIGQGLVQGTWRKY